MFLCDILTSNLDVFTSWSIFISTTCGLQHPLTYIIVIICDEMIPEYTTFGVNFFVFSVCMQTLKIIII